MDKGIGYSSLITDFIEGQYQEERADVLPERAETLLPDDFTVKTDVVRKNGVYIVYLVYINIEDPTHFVRVPARVCRNRKIAEIVAFYKCQLCACEQCVPLGVNLDDFDFAEN